MNGPKVRLRLAPEAKRTGGLDLRGWEEAVTPGERSRWAKVRGCGYYSGDPATHSMTVAELTALLIASAELSDLDKKERGTIDAAACDAIAWLQENWGQCKGGGAGQGFSNKTSTDGGGPKVGWWEDAYHAYGMERLGVLGNLQSIGGRSWYAEGAKAIVQLDEFSSRSACPDCSPPADEAFYLLFLCRGTRKAFAQPYEVGELKPPSGK